MVPNKANGFIVTILRCPLRKASELFQTPGTAGIIGCRLNILSDMYYEPHPSLFLWTLSQCRLKNVLNNRGTCFFYYPAPLIALGLPRLILPFFNSIPVHSKLRCYECFSEKSFANCSTDFLQTCEGDATRCGSVFLKQGNALSYYRKCFSEEFCEKKICEDPTLKKCEIDCCADDNCNTKTDAEPKYGMEAKKKGKK